MPDDGTLKELNIFFADLNEATQEEVLKFYGAKDSSELNMDFFWFPLFTLTKEEDEKEINNGI